MKRTVRQIASCILAVAMVFSLLPTLVLAAGANPTVDAAVSTVVGTTPSSNVFTIDISGNPSVIGTLDLDDLKADYPNLALIDVRNTNITDVVDTTSTGIQVMDSGTFKSNSRHLQAAAPINYSIPLANDIDLDTLVAGLTIDVSDGTVIADLLATGLPVAKIDNVPVTVTSAGTFGRIAASDLATQTSGSHILTLEFAFQNSAHIEVVSFVLNILDTTLSMVGPSGALHQGGTYTYTVSKLDEHGVPEALVLSDINIVMTTSGATTATTALSGNNVVITVVIDASEPAGSYNIAVTDAASGKTVNSGLTVQSLATLTGLSLEEVNPAAGAPVPVTSGDTVFILGGTSIASTTLANLSTYTASTVYLLYDGATPISDVYCPVLTLTDNGTHGVQGTMISVGGNAAVRVSAVANSSGSLTGTFTVAAPSMGISTTVDYAVQVSTPQAYGLFQIDPGEYANLNVEDIESLINNSASVGVTLLDTYTHVGGGWNPSAPIVADVLEGKTTYFALAAQYSTNGNDPWFVSPFGSVDWYEGNAGGTGLVGGPFAGGGWTAFNACLDVEGETVYTAANGTEGLLIQANLGSGNQTVTAASSAQISGGTPNTLYFNIHVIPRSVDHYEFRDATGANTLTADSVAIGSGKDYRVYAVYDNGNVEWVDFSDPVFSSLTLGTYDTTVLSNVTAGGQIVRANATRNGGFNDAKLGASTIIRVTDGNGKTGSLTISLASSLVERFTHYVETPAGIFDYTAPTNEIKQIYDANSLSVALAGVVEIPRGLSASVWVVPVFSNDQMYNSGVGGTNEWKAFGVSEPVCSSGSISTPIFNATTRAFDLVAGAAAVDVGVATPIAFNAGASHGVVSVVSNGVAHALADSTVTNSTQFNMKIAEAVLTELDVESFDAGTNTYTPVFYSAANNQYEIVGNVGDKVVLRVRATYSDGTALDLLTNNTANTYAGGTYFLPMDNFNTYDPTMGNMTTPTATSFAAGSDTELSVLYGSLLSKNPVSYGALVNGGTPPTAGDWVHPHTTGGAVQGALATLSNRIKPHVKLGDPTHIEFGFATQNNAVVPGHYTINMLQSGGFTLDFSGQYNNNGYNKETAVNGIGGLPIAIKLTVQAPTVERVYLVSDDVAFTAQDTTNTPATNVHVLDTTGMTTPFTFYVYPVILDSSYYTTATYATNGIPTNLTSTGDVGTDRGLNYIKASDWAAGAYSFVSSSNINVTQDNDGTGYVRLKVQLLGSSIAQAAAETVTFTLSSISQTASPDHLYHSFGTAWQLPDLFGVYTSSSPVVTDINIGTDYNSVPGTSGTNSVELGGSIFYPVAYQLSDQTTRSLQNSERPAVGYTGTNVLIVTPGTSNPGACGYSVIGTGDLRFVPSVVGTYTFNLSTVNVVGDTLPTVSQGIRSVTFTVTAQNMTETVCYGESVAISGLPAGTVSLMEDGTALLNPNELNNGRLEMLNNVPDTTVIVKVFDGTGAEIARITVDLKQANEAVVFAPSFLSTWYTFANNESIAVQWMTTYINPVTTAITKVVYENVLASEWAYVSGSENFLTLSGSTVTAFTTSSGIQYAIYAATHTTSGAVGTVMVFLDDTLPLPTYSYELRNPATSATITGPVSLAAGQSIDVQVFDLNANAFVSAFLTSAAPSGVVTVINHGSYATIIGSSASSSTVTFTPLQGGSVSLNVNVTPPVLSTATVSGVVVDAVTSLGIANATVDIGGHTVTTNASGHFSAAGVANGTHVVTATAAGYIALLNGSVTVSGANVTMPSIQLTPISSGSATVSVAPATSNLPISGTANLTATPSGFGGTVTYTWTSSNPAIVSVAGSGATATVTGLAIGTVTITCVATDGTDTATATAMVTVSATAVSVSISPSSRSITVGATTSFTATPTNFGGTVTYSWSSSNPAVATVSGTTAVPVITGVSAGTTSITCVVTDGLFTAIGTATVTVTTGGGGSTGGGGIGGPGGGSSGATTFSVTYNANGGTGSKVVANLNKDSEHVVLTMNAADISRTGYEFLNWNTKADGSGTEYAAGTKLTITADVTLYAQWQKKADTTPDISLNTVDHFAYMNGKGDGKFMPDANMTRAEVAQMLYNLMVDQTIDSNNSVFSDVYSDAWYSTAVVTLASKGIIKGYADGTFRPNATITRAEFVTMLARFGTLSTGAMKFSDVPTSHWAYDYILSASVKGWTNGYTDGTFRPAQNITRAEAARMTNVMLGRSADQAYVDAHMEMNRFSDVKTSHWAFYEIMEATVGHDYIKNSAGEETWTGLN